MLCDLVAEGIQPRLTIGFTPVLADQLADAEILANLESYLRAKITAAEGDIHRPEAQTSRGDADSRRRGLARLYRDAYAAILHDLRHRYGRDIIGAFRRLQDRGTIEIITGMATHCYSPLLARDSTLFAQLALGIASYERHFGRKPRAIWLPECAYRPAYIQEGTGVRKPGLEEFLAAQGIACFFAETFMIEGGYQAAIQRRQLVPMPDYHAPVNRTTFLPYLVAGSGVAVIGRNHRVSVQVWSAERGYPGDGAYREFHKKDPSSGLPYWSVTDRRVDLAQKDFYDPERAAERIADHANHFVELLEWLLGEFHDWTGLHGLIAANFDTELFGHWWFEGIAWLKQVLTVLARSEVVESTTVSDFLAAHPPEEALVLPEGSWGWKGTHATWLNTDTEWLWPLLHDAESAMESLVARHWDARGDAEVVLQQIARELLLLESGDWPFLISTGAARAYSTARFKEHLARFDRLRMALEDGRLAEARLMADEYYLADNPFPAVDWRMFAEREGRAG